MPIIICTGNNNLIFEEKAKAMGLKGFALNPRAMRDLATLVSDLMG